MMIASTPGESSTHNVDLAYEALTCFANDLTRGQAAALLEMWAWSPTLSSREVAALLDRFADGGKRS
jgi:hypothetical protein